jgi:hypothetical protein
MTTDLIEVWLAPPAAADAFDPASLDAAGRAQWQTLRSARRRRDWSCGRALLQAASPVAGRALSLSHSHGFAALALAPAGVAIGVDVEWLADRAFAELAAIVFSPAESKLVVSLDEPARRRTFYELWTLKEACAKAFGLPLLDALRTCRFVSGDLEWQADLPAPGSWRVVVYAPAPELCLSAVWATDGSGAEPLTVVAREWPARTVTWTPVRALAHPPVGTAPAC